MAKVNVYNLDGKELRSKELPDRIFGVAVKPELVEQVIVAQRANARQVVGHTKTRAEVRGGGKKPWRQKGTGRARHGSIRSPLWRGGGVTFGPRPNRRYRLKVNQKTKQKALFMALSDKVAANRLVLVDALDLAAIKTKTVAAALKKLPLKRSALIVLPGKNERVEKSSRNIPGVNTIRADSLNVLDVVKHQTVLMPEEAVEVIAQTYSALSGAKE